MLERRKQQSVTSGHFESNPGMESEALLLSFWSTVTVKFEVVSLSPGLRQTTYGGKHRWACFFNHLLTSSSSSDWRNREIPAGILACTGCFGCWLLLSVFTSILFLLCNRAPWPCHATTNSFCEIHTQLTLA